MSVSGPEIIHKTHTLKCVGIVLSFNGTILASIAYHLIGILVHAGNVVLFDCWLTKSITSYIQFLTQ